MKSNRFFSLFKFVFQVQHFALILYNGAESIELHKHVHTSRHKKKIYDTNFDDNSVCAVQKEKEEEERNMCLDVIDAPKKSCLFVKCQ